MNKISLPLSGREILFFDIFKILKACDLGRGRLRL